MARAKATRREDIRDRITIPVIAAVVLLWFGSGVFAMLKGDIRVFAGTTPLMGGVIGFAIGVGLTRKNGVAVEAER